MSANTVEWRKLAQIRAERMKERSSIEWKLWVSHLGGLGGFVFGIATQLKDELVACPVVGILFGFALAASFYINRCWIRLVQRGHAYDGAMFRYCMDRASKVLTCDVIATERRQQRDRARAIEYEEQLKNEHPYCICQSRVPKITVPVPPPEGVDLSREQKEWSTVHYTSAVLVHLVALLILLWVYKSPKRPVTTIPVTPKVSQLLREQVPAARTSSAFI